LIAEARRILTAAGPEHNSLVVMVADPVASYADFLEGLAPTPTGRCRRASS
jgi:hypothetical protein